MDSIVPPSQQSNFPPQWQRPPQSIQPESETEPTVEPAFSSFEPIEEFDDVHTVDEDFVEVVEHEPQSELADVNEGALEMDSTSELQDSSEDYIPTTEVGPEESYEGTYVPTASQSAETATEKVSYADSSIQELDVTSIVANPFQPRTQFKPEALQELADSIKEHGVIQPLVVTETPNGYELVVGERRFRASQLAGLTKVPAIVKKTLHDQTKLEVALIENIQRQELNAIEEARGYDRLIKSFNLTQDQVAKKVGKSRSAVANTLRLLNLPAEIQRGVIEGRITEGHARAILGLGEMEKMILMYQTIQEQGLNVRQVEAKVREITVRRRIDAATPDPKLMALETELRGKLGTQVKIQRQGRGGKITIDFFSDEDLEEIMNRIAEQQESQDNNYLVV